MLIKINSVIIFVIIFIMYLSNPIALSGYSVKYKTVTEKQSSKWENIQEMALAISCTQEIVLIASGA